MEGWCLKEKFQIIKSGDLSILLVTWYQVIYHVQWSFDLLVTWYHAIFKNCFILTSIRPINTNLVGWCLMMKSFYLSYPMIFWSCYILTSIRPIYTKLCIGLCLITDFKFYFIQREYISTFGERVLVVFLCPEVYLDRCEATESTDLITSTDKIW